MTGPIDMNGQTIDSLPEPAEPDHAANKQYVDTGDAKLQEQVNAKLPKSGGTMTGAIMMNNQAVTGLPTPANPTDAVTKQYADDLKSQMLPSSGGTMSGAINMGNNTITALGAPVGDTDATNKEYVDGAITSAIKSAEGDADAKYLPLAGGTMKGPIDMSGQKITGTANPTDAQDVSTKRYVDVQISNVGKAYLPLAGGTMTGPIAMGGQKITGAADPTEDKDVATKAYVDGEIENAGGTYLPIAGGTMTGPIKGLENPTENDEAANKAYVDAQVSGAVTTADGKYLALAGGTMTGNINMVGNTVTGLKAPVNDSDAVNLAYVKEHIPTDEYLPLEGGTMEGDVDMGNHVITSLQMPEGEDDGDAVNRWFVKNYNRYVIKYSKIKSLGIQENLTTQLEDGTYFIIGHFQTNMSADGYASIQSKYADGQTFNICNFNAAISHIYSVPYIVQGPCEINLNVTTEFTNESELYYIIIKIGDTGDSMVDIGPSPTITNLSTASITSTSVNLKEITAKITITPAEENPVITGVRLYYNTGATVDKEGRTLIGTYEYSQFNDNTITVTKEASEYNAQYTISVDAYYSGVVPELVQATPGSATVTTNVST